MKKKIMVFMSIALALLITTGCTMRTTKGFEQACDSRLGSHIDDLIRDMGPPAQITPLSEGKKMYTWDFSYSHQGSYTLPQTNYTSGYVGNTYYTGQTTSYNTHYYTVNKSCVVHFQVRPDGIIEWYRFRGNNCKLEETPE
jgi:hypothetical protein